MSVVLINDVSKGRVAQLGMKAHFGRKRIKIGQTWDGEVRDMNYEI